jgi:hypothetical protein
MKRLLLLLFILFAISSSAQKILKFDKLSSTSVYVKGNDFEGVVFAKNKSLDIDTGIVPPSKRFTPNSEDILLGEKLLHTDMDTCNNSWKEAKYVHRMLRKYIRQYIGYVNEKGEHIIYINAFIREPDFISKKDWLDHIPIVMDGGNSYWRIKINLNTKELFKFNINGVA